MIYRNVGSMDQWSISVNGGSAGNAMHIANDFHYGVGCNIKVGKPGIRFVALPSNPSILTCLANDIGYENIYEHQLKVLAESCDILIVLSGSGNSKNVINALNFAKIITLNHMQYWPMMEENVLNWQMFQSILKLTICKLWRTFS